MIQIFMVSLIESGTDIERTPTVVFRMLCLVALAVPGCREPPLPGGPTPTFVAPRAATSIDSAQLQWKQGERMVWSVTWRGLRVGTAELDVLGRPGALRIESRFRTVGLAHQMNPVDHHLVTTHAVSSRRIDDLHSAFGRLRSWAAPGANPASLTVRHADRNYQLDLAQPALDNSLSRRTLRIEGQARSGDLVIDITMWLSADVERAPLQITLAQDGKQVHAVLLGSES